MAFPYNEIIIIYNPNSTGDSESNARELKAALEQQVAKPITLVATKHAGHAEEIARKFAQKSARTLIISSSGDGGYNEVINGVLSATKNNATTFVLPSGNANDHHNATKRGEPLEQIVGAHETSIEVIEVSGTLKGKAWKRYAHSYVGIGLTAHVGKKLTETKLNAFNEKYIVLKYVALFRHVTIRRSGKRKRYTSIVFATIHRMSKVLKLTGYESLRDGKMEVYEMRERSTIRTFLTLISGSTKGFSPTQRTASYEFETTKATPIQLDGEVFVLDAKTNVTVRCRNTLLRVIR